MQFSSCDSEDDDEYIGVGFVGISRLFSTQDAFFFVRDSFNRLMDTSPIQEAVSGSKDG